MKPILLLIAFLIFAVPLQAQNNDSQAEFEKLRRNRENLLAAAALSEASKALHERLSETGKQTVAVRILEEAVSRGDKSIVPYLKARKEGGYGPAQHIDLALVALGETQYVDLAFEEVVTGDAATRYWAIWRLARFKTKESYRKLYELLDDETIRDDRQGDDYVIMPVSWVVKDILSSEVGNPPAERQSTPAWKEWFRKNNLID